MRGEIAAIVRGKIDTAARTLGDCRATARGDLCQRTSRRDADASGVGPVGDITRRDIVVTEAAGGQDGRVTADGVVGEVTMQTNGVGRRIVGRSAQEDPDLGEGVAGGVRDEHGAGARRERVKGEDTAAADAGADNLEAAPCGARGLGRVAELDGRGARRDRDLTADADVAAGEEAVHEADGIGLTHARDGKRRRGLQAGARDGLDAAGAGGIAGQGERAGIAPHRRRKVDAVVGGVGRGRPPVGRIDWRGLSVNVHRAPGVDGGRTGGEDAVIRAVRRGLAADADGTTGREAGIGRAERVREPDAALRRFADQGDIAGGADDGPARAAGVDAPVSRGRCAGESAVARQRDIAARADAFREADACDLAATFERGRTGRRQSSAGIDLDGRKRATRIAGKGEIAGVATHGCGQQHALAARQPRDGPPVRGADRGVRAIQGDIPVGVDRGGGGRIQAAVISAAGRPDADGAAGGRGRAVAGEDRRTEVGAGPLGVNGDPDIAALGPDGLGRGRHVERHHIRLRAGRGDRDVAAGDDIVIQQRRVILAANPGQGDGRRRVNRRPTLLQDRAVARRITRDGDAAVEATERTPQHHTEACEGIRQGPPVRGVHRGDLSVDDDRTPGRDGLSVFETETEVTVAGILGLAAEADTAARRRRRRVAGQQVGVHAETIAAGLPGDADITRLRPDGLRGRQQLHRRTPAHGGRRQSVDDDVALRRDGVVDVDRADGPDAGQGDLLRGLERRASDHADAVTAGTERVACQRHAVGVTAHRGTQVDAVRAIGLCTCPPIGEADRGALAVQNDWTPSPDGRGRDGIDAVILLGPFDRAAVERDAAAAGRREDRIQGGDRLAEVKPAPTTEAGAGDRDVADQGGDRGAIQSGAIGRIDITRIPDRTTDAVDHNVTLGAPDDDIVTTDGLDADATRGLTQDGDVSRRGDLLGRTVEKHAAVAGGGRRAGCGLDDAVDVGRALQRDAAVGRDERAVDRLGPVCRRIRSGEDDVPAHGRRDVLEQSQRGGGTIAIGVDDDVAGRGQRGGVEDVDTVAAARNGCATVAVTGKKNATDRRSAAGRNRTLQGKPRDAAADDTHITQRRSDGA